MLLAKQKGGYVAKLSDCGLHVVRQTACSFTSAVAMVAQVMTAEGRSTAPAAMAASMHAPAILNVTYYRTSMEHQKATASSAATPAASSAGSAKADT
jgi:hypothetical protein